jgi:Cu/Ag efflux pump CusA
MMTVTAAMAALLPILWSTGAGADTMKRIAAPMVGGLATSFVLELVVYPFCSLSGSVQLDRGSIAPEGPPLRSRARTVLSGRRTGAL